MSPWHLLFSLSAKLDFELDADFFVCLNGSSLNLLVLSYFQEPWVGLFFVGSAQDVLVAQGRRETSDKL